MSITANTVGVVTDEPFGDDEAVAVGAFLAGYSGNTRARYATDLRIFATWSRMGGFGLFELRRSHLENGRMRSTVARRLSTLVSFYRYCEQEGLTERNPALNVHRPRVGYESRTLSLDRNQLGAFSVKPASARPGRARWLRWLAPNGLRISEALNANVADLDFERGGRPLGSG